MTMEKELKKYGIYSRDLRYMLTFVGIWPYSQIGFERFVAYFASSCISLVTLSLFYFCAHHISNVMILTKCMGLAISFFSSLMKICIFLMCRDDLLYLTNFLSAQYSHDLKKPENRPHLLSRFPSFSRLFYVLTSAHGFIYAFSVALSLSALKHGVYAHIVPTMYPFGIVPGGSLYWIFWSVETASGFFVSWVAGSVDATFGFHALQICGQLRLLGSKFENLDYAANCKENFKECMERHRMLMRSRDALQRVFGFLTIWLVITSAMAQCSLVFQAKKELKNMTPFRMGFFFFYISMKYMQAFTYAWYGHLITEESVKCTTSIYNGQWPGSRDMKFKKNVLFVLSQKPLIFKAKGCLQVQLDMFSKIVHASMSYFFLLQTLEEGTKN